MGMRGHVGLLARRVEVGDVTQRPAAPKLPTPEKSGNSASPKCVISSKTIPRPNVLPNKTKGERGKLYVM